MRSSSASGRSRVRGQAEPSAPVRAMRSGMAGMSAAAAIAHVQRLLDAHRSALLQPTLPIAWTQTGETALLYLRRRVQPCHPQRSAAATRRRSHARAVRRGTHHAAPAVGRPDRRRHIAASGRDALRATAALMRATDLIRADDGSSRLLGTGYLTEPSSLPRARRGRRRPVRGRDPAPRLECNAGVG